MRAEPERMKKLGLMAIAIIGALIILALPFPTANAAVSQSGDTAEFWILGVEYKGTAGANEPYIAEGKQVERYIWFPETITVQKGQTVRLHFLGINGGSGHPTIIENYVTTSFTVMRNQTVTKEFVADKAGVFAIICTRHQPTMNAYLVVEDPGAAATPSMVNFTILGLQGALVAVTIAIAVLIWRRGRP